MKDHKPRKLYKSLRKVDLRWAAILFVCTCVISVLLTLLSGQMLNHSGLVVSFFVLILFILVGVVFDMLGIAVATRDEKPFHSMAARKRFGAVEALRLVRKAEKVSSFCSDMVGDICAIISGAAMAVIVTQLISHFQWQDLWPSLVLTGLVAGLTVGGKAMGKTLAMNYNTEIVHSMGKIIRFFTLWRRKGS